MASMYETGLHRLSMGQQADALVTMARSGMMAGEISHVWIVKHTVVQALAALNDIGHVFVEILPVVIGQEAQRSQIEA